MDGEARQVRRATAEAERNFYSWLMLGFAPFALVGGWLFLMAGTGVYLLGAGVAMVAVGVALRPSWPRLAAGVGSLAIGCMPLWLLMTWAAF